jgi:hypothetical protein
MANEVRGGGRMTPVADGGGFTPQVDSALSDHDESGEEMGLSAVRELALGLGLVDCDDPLLWEPA